MSAPEPRCVARRAAYPGPARRQAGMSIIELMVGIVVSMLVALAAAGSAMMFTASQRQGVGASGAGLGASSAITALKNDAALAGLGFFGDANYLCGQLALSVGAAVLSDAAPFTPVRVTAGANGDTVDVVYGDRVESGANVLLDAASDGSTAELMSLLPVAAGQAVLLAPATAGGTCLVRTVTAVTASTPIAAQTVTFADTGKYNKAAFSVAPAFAERDRITLLGELNWNRYRRDGNTLVMDRPLGGEDVLRTVQGNPLDIRGPVERCEHLTDPDRISGAAPPHKQGRIIWISPSCSPSSSRTKRPTCTSHPACRP